jgi:hypothetical protein
MKPQTEEQYWERFDHQAEAYRENHPPMKLKRYIENIICLCSEEKFGQDAVEWAIMSGHVRLTYDLQTDLMTIMGTPVMVETPIFGPAHPGQYDAIIEAYQKGVGHNAEVSENEGLLIESYAPLIAELQKAA